MVVLYGCTYISILPDKGFTAIYAKIRPEVYCRQSRGLKMLLKFPDHSLISKERMPLELCAIIALSENRPTITQLPSPYQGGAQLRLGLFQVCALKVQLFYQILKRNNVKYKY